ncbi:hypothetical protein OHV05_35380 (plasmid) [Kitasatospora sp. NBC_00070]|uniref:hypothetical protein n=1 Tax=Kitasatospora sp. NBC_00070 TaxID=2975962 RepID=UPI002F916B77
MTKDLLGTDTSDAHMLAGPAHSHSPAPPPATWPTPTRHHHRPQQRSPTFTANLSSCDAPANIAFDTSNATFTARPLSDPNGVVTLLVG